jgi:hypothetical protein
MHLTYRDLPAHTDVVSASPAEAGAPEIEITPAMVEAGLEWLYAWSPDANNGRETVTRIIECALANSAVRRHPRRE